jgi:hypothetical protein
MTDCIILMIAGAATLRSKTQLSANEAVHKIETQASAGLSQMGTGLANSICLPAW